VKVASKFDDAKDECCPNCREKFRDFLKPWGKNLLGCYKCGTVFIPKRVLIEERAAKRQKLLDLQNGKEQEEDAATTTG